MFALNISRVADLSVQVYGKLTLQNFHRWRFFIQYTVSSIPKRHTIATFCGVNFNSIWVLKKSYDSWSGVYVTSGFWIGVIAILGFAFRVSEHTACLLDFTDHPDCQTERGLLITYDQGASWLPRDQENYPGTAWWLMFITSATVGYGDVRVIFCVCATLNHSIEALFKS